MRTYGPLAIFVAVASAFVQLSAHSSSTHNGQASQRATTSAQSSPQNSGPSLQETLDFLARVIAEGKVSASGDVKLIDGTTEHQDLFGEQRLVVTGQPNACIITWDYHYYGTNLTDTTHRVFLSLPSLHVSDLKVMDLKSYAANKGEWSSWLGNDPDLEYSGYAIPLNKPSDVIWSGTTDMPNPSNAHPRHFADVIFFADRDLAERAKNALVHAATLCGAKHDPF